MSRKFGEETADKKALALNPRQTRLAVTVPDPNTGIYPDQASEPNTYWIAFCDGTFPLVQGKQVHSLNLRECPDHALQLAHNIVEGQAAYCEKYTLLIVTAGNVAGDNKIRWWFEYWGEGVQGQFSNCPSTAEPSSGSSSSSGSPSSGSLGLPSSGSSSSSGSPSSGSLGLPSSGSSSSSGSPSSGSLGLPSSSSSEDSGGSSGGSSGDSGGSSGGSSGDSGGSSGGSSGDSGGSSDGSSGSGDSGSGSSKDTAVVPASWSPGGYTALAELECPSVRFDDVLVDVAVERKEDVFLLDPKYVEVCERGTIRSCGFTSRDALPYTPGIEIDGGLLRVRLGKGGPKRVRLQIRLTAIRRGFRDWRFPDRTREQFEFNEARVRGELGIRKK
jgi:hypothetical protein